MLGVIISPSVIYHSAGGIFYRNNLRMPRRHAYADDLPLITNFHEVLKEKLEALKEALELKRRRGNIKKIKMISFNKVGKFRKAKAFPCSVYRKVVGSNSIPCQFCKIW